MAVSTTIPVTVAAEAAARVAELEMQREFEQMLEHARQTLPDLRRIEVTLEHSPDEPEEEPCVLISPCRPHPGGDRDPARAAWRDWFIEAFPGRVRQHFCLLMFYEGQHGR